MLGETWDGNNFWHFKCYSLWNEAGWFFSSMSTFVIVDQTSLNSRYLAEVFSLSQPFQLILRVASIAFTNSSWLDVFLLGCVVLGLGALSRGSLCFFNRILFPRIVMQILKRMFETPSSVTIRLMALLIPDDKRFCITRQNIFLAKNASG